MVIKVFTKVEAQIWSDTKYMSLSDDGKLLFLYTLSCTHRNMIGIYFLPVPYGAFDLNWDNERFVKGLQELSKEGFINYNSETNIIFIKNFLKHNPLENPNQVKGAMKALDSIPTNGINREFIDYLKGFDRAFLQPLIELLEKRLPKHVDVDVEEDVYVKGEEEGAKTPSSSEEVKPKDEFKEIAQLYQNVIGQPNGLTSDWIEVTLKEYGFEWFKNAMLESEKRGKRNKKYVEAILQNWKNDGGMKLGGEGNGTNRKGFGEEVDEYAGLGFTFEDVQKM